MSLLERSNTRLAPLDTVEPDAWAWTGWSQPYVNQPKKFISTLHFDRPPVEDGEFKSLYSRHKVESLLSQCRKEARKEALLEAADRIAKLNLTYASQCKFELRRMAEGEKE